MAMAYRVESRRQDGAWWIEQEHVDRHIAEMTRQRLFDARRFDVRIVAERGDPATVRYYPGDWSGWLPPTHNGVRVVAKRGSGRAATGIYSYPAGIEGPLYESPDVNFADICALPEPARSRELHRWYGEIEVRM